MATHIIKGNGAPTEAPIETGMHYVDETNGDHWLSVGTSSVNDWIKVPEDSAGASTFTALTDTPSIYGAGDAGKAVVVNNTEDGLEFIAQGGGSLPPGGATDDLLQKDSPADGDASFRALTTNPDFATNESNTNQNTSDIAVNKSDITALDGRVTTNEGDITGLTSQQVINTGDISTNEANISTNTNNISTNSSDISGLDTRVTTNEGDISSNTLDIDTNTSDISTINTSVGSANGIAPLDVGARVPKINLPADTVYQGDPVEINIPENNVAYVDTEFGDDTLEPDRGFLNKPFKTIKACVDYVDSQNPISGNEWAIRINPGRYFEEPFILPVSVVMSGVDILKPNVFPLNDTAPLVTMQSFSTVSNINFDGRVGGPGGAASTQPCIQINIALGNAIKDILVSNFDIGVNINDGNGSEADIIMTTLSIGSFGNVLTPIVLAKDVSCRVHNLYAASSATSLATVRNNASLVVTGGTVSNAQIAFDVSNASIELYSLKLLNIGKIAFVDSAATFVYDGGTVIGNSTNSMMEITGTGPFVQMSDVAMEGFTNGLSVIDSDAEVYLNNNVMSTSGDGTSAVSLTGTPRVSIGGCDFTSETFVNTFAIDVGTVSGAEPALSVSDCHFIDYVTAIRVSSGRTIIRHSSFDVNGFSQIGTIGILGRGSSAVAVDSARLSYGTGCIAENDCNIRLITTNITAEEIGFTQKDNAKIIIYQTGFDEDLIAAENWGDLSGNFNSTKVGDTSLTILDQLKVGVPEIGRVSSFGEGAAHSRGLLLYEYNSQTDLYVDVSEAGKNIDDGLDVGIPSIQPDSALYISSELITTSGEPFLFPAINSTISVKAVLGDGDLISEIWNGTSWQPIKTMASQAFPPFRVVNIRVEEVGKSYNSRFAITVERDWQVNDPIQPPLGTDRYWFRIRVASDWFNSAWQFRLPLTVQAANVVTTERRFPLYLDLSIITDANFWATVLASGDDIRITSEDGVSQLPIEIVSFDKIGQTGQIYFLDDEIQNASDNVYYLYYSNATASPVDPLGQYGRVQVWQDYQAVYHLEDGPTNFIDATINGNAAVSPAGMTSVGGVAFGNATQTIDNNSYIEPPFTTDFTDPGRVLTYECWATFSTGATARAMDLSNNQTQTNRDSHFGFGGNSNGTVFFDFNAVSTNTTANIAGPGIHQMALTYDANLGTLAGYVDGGQELLQSHNLGVLSSNFPMRIANRGNAGGTFNWPNDSIIDEVRIAKVYRSAGWYATQWNNMSDPGNFYVIGTEEGQAGEQVRTSPVITSPRWEQIRLIPSTTVIREDGFLEFFGKSRPLVELETNIRDFSDTAGDDAVTIGSEIWYTRTFGIKSNYRFNEGVTNRVTVVSSLSANVDSSSDLRIRIHFVPRGASSGDILWRVTAATSGSEQSYSTDQSTADVTADTEVSNLVISTVPIGQNDKDEFTVIDLEFPITGDQQNFQSRNDLIWFTLERLGGSSLDTYNGPIDVLTLRANATAWRFGSHTEFL